MTKAVVGVAVKALLNERALPNFAQAGADAAARFATASEQQRREVDPRPPPFVLKWPWAFAFVRAPSSAWSPTRRSSFRPRSRSSFSSGSGLRLIRTNCSRLCPLTTDSTTRVAKPEIEALEVILPNGSSFKVALELIFDDSVDLNYLIRTMIRRRLAK